MIQFGGACARYRPALLDFVDRAEIGPETARALSHLDRCARCTTELESIAQAITTLHRIAEDASQSEPAADAWLRLRARVMTTRPARARLMSPVAGMSLSIALIAVLVVPLRIGGSTAAPSVPNLDRLTPTAAERLIEAKYITSTTRHETSSESHTTITSTGSGPVMYPDNIRPIWKEVAPAEPSGLAPEAI